MTTSRLIEKNDLKLDPISFDPGLKREEGKRKEEG